MKMSRELRRYSQLSNDDRVGWGANSPAAKFFEKNDFGAEQGLGSRVSVARRA
jgi:hypothetical protein